MDAAIARYLGGQVSALSPREQRGMERALERSLTATYGHGRLVAGELACLFSHGEQIMDGAASLDDKRRMLAGGKEELNLLMAKVEVEITYEALGVVKRNYRLV
jgi:hypothetical protein